MDALGAPDGCLAKRTAKSCGSGAPTLASSSREASFLGMTGARKPGPREEREGNRNTVARGMPECFGLPVVTTLVCFFHLHTGPRVRPSTRHSLRPLDRGRCLTGLGRASSAARRCRRAVSGAERQGAYENGLNGTFGHAFGISPTARRRAGRPGSRRSASLPRGRARAEAGHPDRRSAPRAPAALPAPWQAMSRPCSRP